MHVGLCLVHNRCSVNVVQDCITGQSGSEHYKVSDTVSCVTSERHSGEQEGALLRTTQGQRHGGTVPDLGQPH